MINLDLSDVTESGVASPGDYLVTCQSAEVKQTNSGTGEYIKVMFEAENGQKFFHMFNMKNENKKAVEIGLGQLKTFVRVSGKKDPNKLSDVAELVGLRCLVKVKVVDKGDEYGPQARISTFKAAPKKSADNPFGV
jgi:predicted adenine nucleotide alpha hydrolase (AANH) superfamily ATPase